MREKTIVVAHRGGPALGSHENTLSAFSGAIAAGATMAELDVRRTRDKQLVCHHDPDIDGARLSEMDYFQINQAAEKKGYSVPLLQDVLSLCHGKMALDIELKEVGYELEVISLVENYLELSEFVFTSFHDSSVLVLKKIDPRLRVGLLVEESPTPSRILNAFSKLTYEVRMKVACADFLAPQASLVDRILLFRMKLMKKPVYVWTANDEATISKLARLGADAIITDDPVVATRVVTQFAARASSHST